MGMLAKPLFGVILLEVRARTENQESRCRTCRKLKAEWRHRRLPWIFRDGSTLQSSPPLIQHLQLSFVFKAVVQLAHRTQPVVCAV